MDYSDVRERLAQSKQPGQSDAERLDALADALELLTSATECNLTQIKVALGHIARLVEDAKRS